MKTLLMVYTTFISKHLTYKQRNILPTTFHENIKMNFTTCRLMPLPPLKTIHLEIHQTRTSRTI